MAQTKDPGASGNATGANGTSKAASLRPDNSTDAAGNANELYHETAAHIRAMCRAASPRWRAVVAWGALRELDPDDAAKVAAHFLPNDGAGPPIPPFACVTAEAGFWAAQATPRELDAYCLACFSRMAPPRQAAFLGHVQRRAVA